MKKQQIAMPLKKSKLRHPSLSQSLPQLTNTEALLECIRVGDLETFRDVLIKSLSSVNKVHMARSAGIGRQTLYDLIDPKKNFNPELSTVAAIIRELAQQGECSHV